MLFEDEESRHDFHKTPALLQVACQVLETHLAEYGVQLELVETERSAGLWIAAVAIDQNMHVEALDAVLDQVNRMFLRSDEIETCALENAEVGLITVRVSESGDLSQLT